MISVQHVTKYFGSVVALNDLSLEICSGETVVIQAPSGSGKSTLLRLIAGLEIPDRGEILIDGELVSSPSWVTPPFTRNIGFVFQRSALWPHMTVSQNIRFAMRRRSKQEASSFLRDLLTQCVMQDLANRYPSQLSGGQARRVALARALAAEPTTLLLDEPLTSLDAGLQEHLLTVLLAHVKQHQTTLVYVTHAADEASRVGGRVIHLSH